MSDELQKQLIRQLKLINIWISFYGIIMIVILSTLVFMIFQVVTFARETNARIDSLKSSAADSMSVQKEVCESSNAFSNLVKEQTDLCKR